MDLQDRLNKIVKKNKDINPNEIQKVIKSDIYYLLNNYFEVDFEDIDIEILYENDSYKININAIGDRIKLAHILPE